MSAAKATPALSFNRKLTGIRFVPQTGSLAA